MDVRIVIIFIDLFVDRPSVLIIKQIDFSFFNTDRYSKKRRSIFIFLGIKGRSMATWAYMRVVLRNLASVRLEKFLQLSRSIFQYRSVLKGAPGGATFLRFWTPSYIFGHLISIKNSKMRLRANVAI